MGCCESMLSSTYPERRESRKRPTMEYNWMNHGGIEFDGTSPKNGKGMHYGGRYKADLYAYKGNKAANRYNTTSADESGSNFHDEDATVQITDDHDNVGSGKETNEIEA